MLAHGFTTKHRLNVHKRLCQPTEAQREVFPYSDPILIFANVKKQLKAPFVAYADFECILITKGDINVTTGITNGGSESATYPDIGIKLCLLIQILALISLYILERML